MALLIRDEKSVDGLTALHVINDEMGSDAQEIQGQRCLEHAASVGASADVKIKTILRYDVSIASGILHTMKERGSSDLVIGLHKKANIVDSFFGQKTMSLIGSTNRQIFIVKASCDKIFII